MTHVVYVRFNCYTNSIKIKINYLFAIPSPWLNIFVKGTNGMSKDSLITLIKWSKYIRRSSFRMNCNNRSILSCRPILSMSNIFQNSSFPINPEVVKASSKSNASISSNITGTWRNRLNLSCINFESSPEVAKEKYFV